MKNIYSISTNRPLVDKYFDTYINEIINMQNKVNDYVPLVIVDESNAETQSYNSELIKSHKNKNVEVIHFNASKQKDLFDYIRKKIDDKVLVDLLDYPGFSYARAMNKQFIVANLLDVDYIHRRDSDVKIMKNEFGFPSDIEINFLGKHVSECKETNIKNYNDYDKDQIVYLVGSGYSGNSDWKADFGVFLEEDVELLGDIICLFNYGKELFAEYMNEIVNGNINVNDDIVFLPPSNHPNPINGNIAYYKIFNYLPCCTVLDTIGSDNFIRSFLKRLNSPIVYHNKFVYHKFGDDRNKNNMEYLKQYYPRLINKLIYYKIIEYGVFEDLKISVKKIQNIDDIDFKNIMNMEKLNKEYIAYVCHSCIDDFKNIMSKAKNYKIREVYYFINRDDFYSSIENNMYNGIMNGNILLKEWPKIMSICRTFNVDRLVRE